MRRRSFLQASLGGSLVGMGGLTASQLFIRTAVAAPAQPGSSPYGPLLEPDANGLRLPEGFTSQIIATGLQPVGTIVPPYQYKPWPDGAATFPTDDGGWILVTNSENPPPAVDIPLVIDELPQDFPAFGGVNAIRFDAEGNITDAYEILSGTRSNCAGGATPWGTWLSCEEFEAFDRTGIETYDGGVTYECDPFGEQTATIVGALGHFKHESATVDPATGQIYLSEDITVDNSSGGGLFYRFTPAAFTPGQRIDFDGGGKLEAAVVAADGSVTWVEIAEPDVASGVPTRVQGTDSGATEFDGGEGCVLDAGSVFLTTKGDDRVWEFDVAAQTMTILYDGQEFADNDDERILRGVDHVNIQPGTGNLVVAEDGGNLEAVMVDRETNTIFPILRMEGPQHGFENPTPIPTVSEVTGIAFNPDGDRLYFSSQRGLVFGITYEVTGPFAVQPARPEPESSPTTEQSTTGPTLPATGPTSSTSHTVAGLGALAGAAVAWRARRSIPGRGRESG